MPYLDTLRALISEKEADIARLEAELSAARAYVLLLTNRLQTAERRLAEAPQADDPVLAVRRILAGAGQPLFIDEILHELGQPVSRDAREDLRRLVLPWVRRGEVFTRPRPGTYGLAEWEQPS
jgi:hypothetical protein